MPLSSLPGSEPDWRERTLARLRSALFHNLGFKILAVIFAVALWAWVLEEQGVERVIRVRLHWRFPDELSLVEEVPNELMATISGSQVVVRNVAGRDFRMDIDLSENEAGHHVVDFRGRSIVNLPANIRVVDVTPPMTELELEEKEQKYVEVVQRFEGSVPSGYELKSHAVSPATVALVGPRTVVESLEQVRTTTVDLEGRTEDFEEPVDLTGLPPFVHRVGEETVRVSGDVEPLRARITVDEVPVVVRTRGWQSTVEHVAVSFEGPVLDLDVLEGHPDRVTLLVSVADDAPDEELVARRDGNPASYQVVHPEVDNVELFAVEPSTFTVVPLQQE